MGWAPEEGKGREGKETELGRGVGRETTAGSRDVHKGRSEAAMTLGSYPELAEPPPKEGCSSGKATPFS